MSLFGKAKFGGNKLNWFKLKDGDSTYRILPPMGDLQEDGRWSQFFAIHYGYKNSEGKMRTFQSPLVMNRKTKMVESPDAALERIETLKAKLEAAKEAGNSALVAQLMEYVGGKKSRFNLDKNHYMNVIDLQGNIGILKIRHKAKLALDTQIKKLRDSGIEPLDPETGRFFTFTRSGMGMDTVYQVSVYKRKLTVAGVGEVEQDFVHTITDEIAKRCLTQKADGSYTYKEAARLDTLFKKPTSEEVARIVAEGEKAVDEIFDTKPDAGNYVDDDGGPEDDATETAPATAAPAAAPVRAAELPVNTEAPVQATNAPSVTAAAVTLALATSAPVVATATQAPTAAPAAAPKTTAQAVAGESDADFLKSLGL